MEGYFKYHQRQRSSISLSKTNYLLVSPILRHTHIRRFPKSWGISKNGYGSIPIFIPFLGEWTSINPSYFDVNYRGTIGFDTLPKWWKKTNWWSTYFSTKTVKAWWILLISAPQDVLSTPQIAVRLSAEVQPAALCHLLGHTFRQWPGTLIFFYPGGWSIIMAMNGL